MIWLRRKSIEPGSRYVLGAEIANPRVSVSVPRPADSVLSRSDMELLAREQQQAQEGDRS